MQFDLTNVNLLDFARLLIAFSDGKGIGKIEKEFRRYNNELVESIDENEFHFLLSDFNNAEEGVFRIIDYYKGSPIKLDLKKKKNGQILFSSLAYDCRIGKYKVLELLLDFFEHNDFKIIRKSYGEFENTHFNKSGSNTDRLDKLKSVIKNLQKEKDERGVYYRVKEGSYKSTFLENLF